MLAAGRVWRPLDGQTDASLAPVVRRRRPAARPALPAARRSPSACSPTAPCSSPLDEEQARAQLEVLKRCDIEGVAICLINAYVNPQHEQRLRALAEEVLGDVPISISSEVSPLAKEYARASTTVVDVLMKLMYGGYADQLDRELTRVGLHRRAELRGLRGDAHAVAGGAEAPVQDRVRRSGGGDGLLPPPGRGDGGDEPHVLRRRRDVHGRVARRRGPPVRGEHVRARARHDHQRALDGDLQRGRGRRVDRLDLALRGRPRRARAARAPSRGRPATAGAASCRR